MKNGVGKLFLMFIVFSFFALLASGCGTKTVKSTPEEETKVEAAEAGETAAAEEAPAAEAEEVTSAAIPAGDAAGQPESLDATGIGSGMSAPTPVEGRTSAPFVPVYFDFDRSEIRPDQVAAIEANAEVLKANPDISIRIEGNCDERGTNEYNMALGERRAQSAKRYLENLGIDPSRMTTISYGEERPINHGHDELAWSQNRRDDFVIVGQ